MDDQIIKVIKSKKLWTAVSFALLIHMLKTQEIKELKQEERERSYQDIIKQLINKTGTSNYSVPGNSTITVK